ncbi:uncharacterized protein Dana_GF26809 [Drosophila ananassae]|uniref:Uncharacterized protein n=1 Tax=Drosophila ananassae TaxID=7217 RepID=A0A0P8Y1F1_DROAN|nr:uncharacterized protein Dana_GF27879 [Drosophila ananassae]KPU75630.1 uncharacterized protein Dana_GF26809 [Drosophila ananassae]
MQQIFWTSIGAPWIRHVVRHVVLGVVAREHQVISSLRYMFHSSMGCRQVYKVSQVSGA